MLPEIVSRLKTGSIKSVISFGESKLPQAPYVVVRGEVGDGVRNLRIIVHMGPGCQELLEKYLFGELSDLLLGYVIQDKAGNTNKIRDSYEWTDVAPLSDDGTISMERVFYVPHRTH